MRGNVSRIWLLEHNMELVQLLILFHATKASSSDSWANCCWYHWDQFQCRRSENYGRWRTINIVQCHTDDQYVISISCKYASWKNVYPLVRLPLIGSWDAAKSSINEFVNLGTEAKFLCQKSLARHSAMLKATHGLDFVLLIGDINSKMAPRDKSEFVAGLINRLAHSLKRVAGRQFVLVRLEIRQTENTIWASHTKRVENRG